MGLMRPKTKTGGPSSAKETAKAEGAAALGCPFLRNGFGRVAAYFPAYGAAAVASSMNPR